MDAHPPSRRIFITYVTFYLILAAVAISVAIQIDKRSDIVTMLGMLAFYLALLLAEPRLISRHVAYLHLLNVLQAVIGLLLLNYIDEFDFFSLLLIPPCALSILYFPRKIAFVWIGAICLLMEIVLLVHFPLEESSGLIIAYPAAIFLFTGSAYLALQAEEAQTGLQEANRKLQAYAAQVEVLAAAAERNRLARELHDSVTQIIFGLTLSAQAARILINRDPARAAAELDHIQELSKNALAEMRALIQQLHPRSIAEEGLAPALRWLAAERLTNDKLTVELQICGERRLPTNIEEELFHIAQEALNNIVKHAHTDWAKIVLNLDDANRVRMVIEDAGVGFDPAQTKSLPGHLGLISMAERIQALGGTLTIDSRPGKGTRLRVELVQAREVEHAR